ncbi:MAG: glycosyltransferase [Clostridiales bacterium]|nr:glycosyltransferase [Clostridiales bacterium]
MNTQPSVNIILATYNGQKYLQQQLGSLLAQSWPNMTIYIRDDGSSDDTVAFLRDYIASHSSTGNIILLDNRDVNLGCPASFYQILRDCEPADYYAFCDQDDIWYPEKIQWAVEKLENQKEAEVPRVYISACDYYTDTGEFLRHSPKQRDHIRLCDTLYSTPASGFLIVFDETARQEFILNVDPGKELHDRWILRSAACMGTILTDHRRTATHIRHSDAVTADDSANANLLRCFIQNEICGSDMIDAKQYLNHFYQVYKNKLSGEDRRTLELFVAPNTFARQLRKLFYPRRLRTRPAGEAAIRLLFLMGKI